MESRVVFLSYNNIETLNFYCLGGGACIVDLFFFVFLLLLFFIYKATWHTISRK